MPKIVKLSELNKKDRKKIEEQTQKEVAERKANIQNEISFVSKNESRIPTNTQNNVMSNMPLPVRTNRVQNYNTNNTFPITNNINRSNVGEIQKSTSQKVFEALNPGKKLSYTNNTEYELPTKDKVKNILRTGLIEEVKQSPSKLLHIAKSTIGGGVSGTAGIAQASLSQSANQQEKGSKSGKGQTALNILSVLYPNLPVLDYNLTKEFSENFYNTLNDKEKNTLQKAGSLITEIGSYASNQLSSNRALNAIEQIRGKISPSISKKYMELYDKISNPVRKMNQKIAEEREGQDILTQKLGEAGQSMGNMAPSLAVTALTKNPTAGMMVMGESAKGQATDEALQKGADLNTATKIGDVKKELEIGTEMLTGGLKFLSPVGSTTIDNAVENLINNKIHNRMANFFTKQLAGIGGEIAEETISDVVGTIIDKGTVDPDATYTWNDWWNTVTTTALSTAGLNTVTGGYTSKAYKQNAYELQQHLTKEALKQNIADSQVLTNEEKTQMTNYLNNNDITEADFNAMKEKMGINPVQEQAKQEITNRMNNNQQVNNVTQEQISSLVARIDKSNLPNEDKLMMKDYIQNNNVSQADIDSMNNVIDSAVSIPANNELVTNQNFKDNVEARKKYTKYKNDTGEYNSNAINEVLDLIPENRNGNRTVKQWLQVAKETGTRIADLSNEEIERIAYKSWFDVQPSKNITKYDRQSKSTVGFQKLTSDEWINEINKAVNEARNNQIVSKDTNQVQQEVSNYLKKNNINMSVDQFIEWASNKEIEKETNMTPQQQELYDLINNIQNRTYNESIKNSKAGSLFSLEDTSNNTAENETQRKINRSMTMQEAKDMIQRAFVTGDIYNWYDGKYKNGDEWIAGEGIDDVAMWIENDYNLQNKYINSNQDILNEEYMIEDVLDAYINKTLTGTGSKVNRLDVSKPINYTDNRFYAPRDIVGGKELYEIANQRVTNANRQEVYKARADFIINAHNEGYAESLGLSQKEVNEKLKNWANYPKKAMELSRYVNKDVALQNRWTGIENSSILNELSINEDQIDKLVKQVKGTTNEWQRRYIANTMLAIDTHIDYKSLTYDFAPDVKNMHETALADYSADTDTIRVRREGQNTIAHETGHFIDHLLGRKVGDGYNLGLTRLCRSNYENDISGKNYTLEQKQFLGNFNNFLTSIENSSDIGSKYKMDSQEVFARFVARFTEWTRNTATNNRYGYEAKWYDDNFTTAQYMEFIKLLQEYSKLETTGQVSTKIDKSVKAKYDQRIEDIYSELFKTSKNTPGETINWNEIERPEGKFRKHYQSIIQSSNTTAQAKAIARELMETDTYIPESNKNQLQRADERIQTNGADKELTTLSTNVDNGSKITSVDIAVGERLIEYYSKIGNKAKLQEAIQTTAMAGTQAGQTVQALALLNHQTPQGQVTWIQRSVDKLNKELKHKKGDKAKQFEFTPEMQQKILNAKDKQEMNNVIDEVYQELGQQVPKSFIEKLDSWRYFSMLANPRTHIRNIVGNFAMGKMQGVKNKVAGAIEDTMSLVNKDMERTHTLKRASKETKQFAKNDLNNVDIQTRLELNENKYNPKSRIENSQRTFKSDVLEKTIGKAFNFNDTALEAEDGFGLKHAYVKALSEYMTANKLTPETITEKQLAKARNHAIEEAKEATFHSKNAIATAINQFSRKNKLTKYTTDAILPFVKTPMNVAKAGLEYNPTGLIKTLTVDSVKLRKGNISVNKYIDNLSKGLTGTGLAVLGYAMAKAGILKASGGDDDKKEKYDEALGRQAYSLEINGKTFSLDWLAPAGIPLFVGAEAQNIKSQGEKEKKSISSDDDSKSKQIMESLENWANAMSNSISPMSEMSMISGLTSALKSYDNDSQKMLGTMATNSLKSYVNQFVPTALGQFARTTDEYERNTTSTKTGVLSKPIDQVKLQVMSKIPGLRQKLPTKSDIWGNEVKQQANIPFRAFNNFVNPSIIKDVSINEVDKELNSLYSKTRESSIIPKSIDKTFTIDGENYRMTNEEYAKYNKKYGETSYNLIKGLVTSNDYKNLTDEQKQKAIESVYSYAKEQNKVDYAKENNKEIKQSTLYETMKALESKGGNQSNYLEFISKTSGADIKERQKVNTLYNADYDKNTKDIIYSNTIGKDDGIYNKVKKDNVSINSYLKYKDAVYNETDKKRNSGELEKEQNLKSVDKIKILLNSNFSENEKKSLYSNAIADDDVYSKLLKENINVNEYLNFKKAQLNEKLASDKDKYGQAIRGTSKEKFFKYINSKISGYENRLIIAGKNYKLSNKERQKLVNIINNNTEEGKERINMYKNFSRNFIVNGNNIFYK